MFARFDSYLKKARWLRVTLIALGVLLLGGYFIWGIFRNFGYLLTRSTPFPVSLHSATQANYQADPEYMQIPPMDIQLVIDTIWDQNQNVQDLSLQLTQVHENFIAQVSTVTPLPTSTDTPEAPILTPSETSLPGTDFPPSLTPSLTPIGFIASSTPTEESIPPTSTSSGATQTSSPPTETLPPPTFTPVPPTNTVQVCGQLSAGGFNVSTGTKKASWSISNNGTSAIAVTSITISWPSANGNLTKVKFGNANAWSGSAAPPSKTITGSWSIAGSSANDVVFFFDTDALSSGYNLTIGYGSGCTLNKSN